MKKNAKIVLILLLIFGTAVTFAIMAHKDFDFKSPRVSNTDVTVSDLIKNQESALFNEEISLEVGASYTCTTTSDEKIQWSSSNETVATVTSDGKITAVAQGEAVITAYVSDQVKIKVKVTVYIDAKESVINLITNLAKNGDDDAYNELITLENQLSASKDDLSKKYAALLTALLDYSQSGAGENKDSDELWNALISAFNNAGIDDISKNTLRRAALSAYCHGEKSVSDITISFTGDCTLAYFNDIDKEGMFPDVYRKSGSVSYPFDLIKNVFGADDITMINFEGTLTESTEHRDKQFFFRGEPSYVNILTNSSVEAVTLENNHSFDYLDKGFNDTLKNLSRSGIRYTCLTSPSVIKSGEYRTVMLSLSLVSTTYRPEFQKRIEKYISKYKDDKTVIVINVHWGVESSDTPEQWQIEAAHSMIDAGADLIIGHHPHVLQGIEQYNGKYIAYSLGNFSFGGNNSVSNPNTIILRTSFSHSDEGMKLDSISAVPCHTTSTGTKVNNYQPIVRFGDNGSSTISSLLSLSEKLDGGIKTIKWNKIK